MLLYDLMEKAVFLEPRDACELDPDSMHMSDACVIRVFCLLGFCVCVWFFLIRYLAMYIVHLLLHSLNVHCDLDFFFGGVVLSYVSRDS